MVQTCFFRYNQISSGFPSRNYIYISDCNYPLHCPQCRVACFVWLDSHISRDISSVNFSQWRTRLEKRGKCWIELWHLFSVCFLGYKVTWKQITSSQLIKAKATELLAFSQLSKILRLLLSKRVRLMLYITLATECYEFSV